MCRNIVLSIHHEYAVSIYEGIKKYEFRKVRPSKLIDSAYLYETMPVGTVTGKVRILRVIEQSPDELWKRFGNDAGITYEEFEKYYSNRDVAYAFELSDPEKFEQPILLGELDISRAPQSFCYIGKRNQGGAQR